MKRSVALIGALVIGCSREPRPRVEGAPPESASASRSEGGKDSLLSALEAVVSRFGHTSSSIRFVLGQPTVQSVVIAMGPEEELDTLITMQYPGLEIIVRRSGGDEYLSNVRALDTAFALPRPIRLFATSEAEFTALLGAPVDRQMFGDTSVVGYDDAIDPVIQFYFLGGRLVRIRWIYESG